MKKNIFFICILLFISGTFIVPVFSFLAPESTCSYTWKIEQCTATNSPRAIQDFVCVKGDREKVAYQIILDHTFSQIDNEIDSYLTDLEQNKSFYFGKEAEKNFIEWVDDMFRQFGKYGYFWNKFKDACSGKIITETIACLDKEKTSVIHAEKYLLGQENTCMDLAEYKLEISQKVALNILNLNKYYVRKDQHKLYVQQERSKYNDLLGAMMANIGYMERILHKWPYKLKKVYGQ